ncbi:MAG: hypothetical protein ORO03_11820, partial [Alphaproteobacteria bacterium]|nr:hypothetical protein [Alphaproteobacteria bacterium]
ATPTAGVSYITVANLVTALNTNNVTIDANAATTTGITPAPTLTSGGMGQITVTDAVTATAGTNSLTLTGSQIIINESLTLRGELILNSTRASVWQRPDKVITATRISGSSVDGFILNGANLFTNLGAITNTGTVGVSIKNAKGLTVEGITLDGGTGGVSILAEDKNISLSGAVTVKGSYLRLDLGDTGILGGSTITANGLAVYYTGATSGNSATIAVGSGSFTFVNDKRSVTTAKTLNNSSTATEWGTGLGTLASGTASASGLTVTTSGDASTINNQGVVYGSTVNIQGVGSSVQVASGANNLRYIEGTKIISPYDTSTTPATTSTNAFSGSLALVGSGSSVDYGIVLEYDSTLTVGTVDDGTSNLLLLQNNSASTAGFSMTGSTIQAGGNITIFQTGLVASDAANAGIKFDAHPIKGTASTVTAGGAISITSAGYVAHSASLNYHHDGIYIAKGWITSKNSLRIIQSGYSSRGFGIRVTGNVGASILKSTADEIVITQSGIANGYGFN